MEHLKKPIWLGVSLLFPLALLLILFSETYDVIESLLSDFQRKLWLLFGFYLLLTVCLGSIFLFNLIRKKESISTKIAWGSLLLCILNITSYFYFIDELLPLNIPNWMFTSRDLEIFPYSFLIPGALYSIIILVLKYSPDPNSQKTYINLIPIIGIPIGVFLIGSFFSFILGGAWSGFFFFKYLPIFLLVFLTGAFIFFLIRFIYILSAKSKRRNSLLIFLKIAFTCIFPVLGIYFNNSFDWSSGGLFGDFTHPIFYILSILNGVILCLPNFENVAIRWVIFIAKSVLFTFILYFFAIFIPYLPLSILAILLVGFGFLMLAPIIVFIFQMDSIRKDILYLKTSSNKLLVDIVLILSLFTIPTIITLDYKQDRKELNAIFSFLYERAYNDDIQYSFNPDRVENLLTHIKEVKSSGINHRPFLDSYYNWVVLDNLMLSDEKLNQISNVLRGEKLERKPSMFSWFRFPERRATINNITTKSELNNGHWTSTVVIEVKNEHIFDTEFRMYFETPDDCFISNYYLEIEGEKEYGILAEKRSASWVYNNIVKTRKDPGILTHIGKNKYQVKVFPVQNEELRYTGIEFIHKEPINVSLNDTIITLGDNTYSNNKAYEIINGKGVFIPFLAKKNLPKTNRPISYHVLIDQSSNKSNDDNELANLSSLLSDSLPSYSEINYWAVNHSFSSINKNDIKSDLESIENEGGFYPEYLMKKIIYDSHQREDETCPVFIMVSQDDKNISILNGFSDFLFLVPDMTNFYVVQSMKNVSKYNLESGKKIGRVCFSEIRPESIILFKWNGDNHLVPNNLNSSYLIDEKNFSPTNKWQEGIILDQKLKNYALNPQQNKEWLNIVKASIESNILSPFTAFISLENEAQKKALLKKQGEVLNSNLNLDLEEAEPMSEPHIIWYILLFSFVFFKFRKK